MKKFWLILLMVFFPLQAALAAVEAYMGHGSKEQILIDSVLHAHTDSDLHQSHKHIAADHDGKEDSKGDSKGDGKTIPQCEGDHHHGHAHGLTLLPTSTDIHFPKMPLINITEHSNGFNSHHSSLIERPKWA